MSLELKEYRIDELCNVGSSKRIYKKEYVNKGIPFFRGKEIISLANNENIGDPLFISEERYKELKEKHGVPQKGDILMISIGATLGVPYFVTIQYPFYFKDGNVTWFSSFSDELNSKYLYLWLRSDFGNKILWSTSIGSAQPALTLDALRSIKIKVPPIKVQNRVASILSAFDDLIENNTRRIAILEEMARLIYREWFVHYKYPGHENDKMVDSGTELGEVPEGWDIAKLSDVLLFKKNTVKKSERVNYDYYLPINHIKSKSLLINTYDEIENANSSLIAFNKGDILFGAMRPYFHKVTIAPFRGLTRSTCFIFEPVSVEFLSYSLFTIYQKRIVDIANKKSKGSTIPYAVWDGVMSEIEIIMPPLDLITEYNDLVKPMIEIIHKTFYHNRILKETRELLLSKLISGKIEINDLTVN